MAIDKEIIMDKKRSIFAVLKPYLTIFLAEVLGTMILIFVGCGSGIKFDGDVPVSHHLDALGFGLAVLLAIQIFGHITACHINPTVSITSLLLGYITYIEFVAYILAQFVGSVLGFVLLKLIFPENYIPSGFCMTKLADGITVTRGFFIELVITCLLCFVLCSVWDARNATKGDSVAIRFAFVVTILSIIAGPLTGASMNTARSYGPAVFGSNSDWKDQWIYWTAPNISPFISFAIYKVFFSEPATQESKKRKRRCF
ncbi:hypothetical protein HHI36_011107 [Cryptolaemus montrouzieri]|uniref:Aquaporin n=1 Tax=Cryptolaemus montrouzieri TaxID=559131 RepID=A0ABD2MKS2_9CUCU